MADQLTFLNNALAHLGEDPSDTLDPNTAKSNPRKALRFMTRTRDEVLSAFHWSVARTDATLTRATADGNWNYPYVYFLPADCLRVWNVDGCTRWEKGTWQNPVSSADERACIWADSEGPIDVSYGRRLGWAAIPTHLETAMGYWLASLSCWPINGDSDRADRLMKKALEALALARGADGAQMGGQDPMLPDLFAAERASC